MSDLAPSYGPRLLLIACSHRKCLDTGLLPAIERYDGPAFRVLRRFLREMPSASVFLSIYVLSAQFGLIPADQPIPYYNSRLTSSRASELHPQVMETLKAVIQSKKYRKMYVGMGKDYMRVIKGYDDLVGGLEVSLEGQQVHWLTGLRDWLRDELVGGDTVKSLPTRQGQTVIRGIRVQGEPDEILRMGREALEKSGGYPERYCSWYVDLGVQRVAPKWLVSLLTGLPVSAFTTTEARRALAALGIEALRQ